MKITLADLSWTQTMVYAASPYSLYPDGLEAAFRAACRITAKLNKAGIPCFSPIVHSHPTAIHGHIDPLAHDFWMRLDMAMMKAASCCLVAMLPSWEQSKGVAIEIEEFRKMGKLILYLNPKTMEITECP